MTCFLFWSFFLVVGMLILSLPHFELGSKLTFLIPGFCVRRYSVYCLLYIRQYGTICWELVSFLNSLCLRGSLFGQMESINVAGVLHKAGNADLRICTRTQKEVEYIFIPYTCTYVRLSYL